MNQNQPGSQPAQAVSWATKAGYIGTGVLIGLIVYPFVRKAVAKVQPKLDRVFDDLTGKAEDLAERTSDILARAKAHLKQEDEEHKHDHEHEHEHEHEHDHDHDHEAPRKKSARK